MTQAELARLAALAALEIPDDQRPALAAQLERIVGYVGQLATLSTGDSSPAEDAAPPPRFRPDEVRPSPLIGSLADFAPRFAEGFFVVPRSKGPGGE